MEMEQPRNGGDGKVLTHVVSTGRRRHGPLSMYLDIARDLDAGRGTRSMLPPEGMGSRRRTYADGELDVFAAERYFKGAMDGDADRKASCVVAAAAAVPTVAARPAAEAAVPVAATKPASTRASVASASSAASANSQTVLLRGAHRQRDQRKCCVHVGALMRSCSGKGSVRVDAGATKEVTGGRADEHAEANMADWYKELSLQRAAIGLARHGNGRGVVAAGLPPNLNLGTKVAAIGRELTREEKAAEFARSSSSRRRSLTLLGPARQASTAPGADAGGGDDGREQQEEHDDGGGSESSSDLFEIKSLMIEECPYEPSEASVQWSVATADASERGDRVPSRRISAAGRKYRPVGVGLLAGCVSHRAVDVSPATVLPNAPATVATTGRRVQ